jgi:hypothetical protein
MFMERLRKKEIEKVMDIYPPMQDHLAECTWARVPYEEWDVGKCLQYLKRLHEGLKQAFEHGQLAIEKGLEGDFAVAIIADMLWGDIYNNYPDNLVNCAREVWEQIKKMIPEKAENSKEKCFEWQRSVIKEIKPICDKYEVDFPIDKEWTIQEGYMLSWIQNIYYNEIKEV